MRWNSLGADDLPSRPDTHQARLETLRLRSRGPLYASRSGPRPSAGDVDGSKPRSGNRLYIHTLRFANNLLGRHLRVSGHAHPSTTGSNFCSTGAEDEATGIASLMQQPGGPSL